MFRMTVCYHHTCEAGGTAAGELVDLIHAHAFIQTGGGGTLVHLRFTQRAWDKGARTLFLFKTYQITKCAYLKLIKMWYQWHLSQIPKPPFSSWSFLFCWSLWASSTKTRSIAPHLKIQACTDTGSLPCRPYTSHHSGTEQNHTHLYQSRTWHLREKNIRGSIKYSW